jgi:hypothetical protein
MIGRWCTNNSVRNRIFYNADINSTGLVALVSVATNERIFSNTSLRIRVVNGDYVEMVFYNPNWTTNPLTTITGGYFEVSP